MLIRQRIISISYLAFIITFILKSMNCLSKEKYRIRQPEISPQPSAPAETKATGENIFSVTGRATQNISPNLIRVAIRVDNMEKDFNNSFSNNTETMSKVNSFLMEAGIPATNITTRNYQVVPIYKTAFNPNNSTWTQLFVGYRVVNEIEIIQSNLKNLPEFVDRLVRIGSVYVTYIQFFYSEDLMKKVEDSLLEAATINAFDKANILAKASNNEISHVKFLSVKELNFPKIGEFAYSLSLGDGSPFFFPKVVNGDSNAVMTLDVNFVVNKKVR